MRHALGCCRALVVLLAVAFLTPASAEAEEPRAGSPSWAEAERLIATRELEAASAVLAELLAAARARGDEAEWTRVLVRSVQVRRSLHGHERAVRLLQEEPWPRGEVERSLAGLFYARSLVEYHQAYAWEIGRRERVASDEAVDVRRWTREQIREAALAAYREVWERRAALGERPVAAAAEYLVPNTYPEGVRGTLRDTVSYLLAELLADSSLWSPRESNETFRLDVAALARGGAGQAAALADPGAHPLARLAAVLADLEEWHAAAGRRAAALEARLERLRRLHGALGAADRRAVRQELAASLPAWRDLPWWAMGMATLAEFTRGQPEPGGLARAREIAREGNAAYPESPGGARCLALAQAIEAPDFDLDAMASDGPGQRSLRVRHKNLPALFFRAFPFDPWQRAEAGGTLSPDRDEILELLRGAPAAAWRSDLAPTPDFERHATWVVPPLDGPGSYVIVASPREDFPAALPLLSVELTLGDLVLVQSGARRADEVELLALAGSDGRPAAGAEVRFYRQEPSGLRRAETRTAGADGAVTARLPPGSYLALGRGDGGQAALDLWAGPAAPDDETVEALVYTDRSVYRPGQTIHWKVLAYQGRAEEGELRALAGVELAVVLLDPGGQEAGRATAGTNGFGTASGELAIPAGRPLGGWRLTTLRGAGKPAEIGSAAVQVEEYRRPTFEVALADPAEPLRLNRPARVTLEARSYFGLPVAGGEARWQVTREPVYRWWAARGGAAGPQVVAAGTAPLAADGTCEVAFTPAADEREGAGTSYRYRVAVEVTDAGGETRTAERSFRVGQAAVEVRIEGRDGFLRAARPAAVAVWRGDLDGAPRSGAGSWELYELRQPARVQLPSELPLPAAEAGAFHTPGDALRPRWDRPLPEDALLAWPDGRRVAGGRIRHDAGGRAEVRLGPLAPGVYRLRYETRDDLGAVAADWRELIVAGEEARIALPALLRVESPTVRVGGTARLLAHSGIPGQTLYLETYRGGRLVARRRLQAGRGPSVIELPVRRADRGGFAVKLLAVRGHELIDLAATVQVPWDDRALEVSFSRFRDEVRPGARETWTVAVRQAGGAAPAAGAELLAAMVDRSLDLFGPHEPPDLFRRYPDRTDLDWTAASLGGGSAFWVAGQWQAIPPPSGPRPDSLRFLDDLRGQRVRWGALTQTAPERVAQTVTVTAESPLFEARSITMSASAATAADQERPADPAPPPPAPPPPPIGLPRSDFAETAFWQPHLLTGPDGTAELELTVPDSVTSWHVWVHAVTADLRTGSAHRETRSVKDLMVRPSLPRFLREGDRAELRVVVHNASRSSDTSAGPGAGPLRGEVVLDLLDPATGESLLTAFGLDAASARRPFAAPAGGAAALSFPVTAPRRPGPVNVRVSAVAGGLSDGELRPLPVLPARLQLAQSRSAALRGRETRVLRFADLERDDDPTRLDEQLVVTLDAQLFSGVLAALPYLAEYPYQCTEQTLNRFLAAGIVAGVFERFPAVADLAAGLARRDTRLEAWDGADPNRAMTLEETPWRAAAGGGPGDPEALIRVLDPQVARAERDAGLARLRAAQLPSGAFPWWPGGPPSPYMTVYLMHGFARAAEHGVEVPRDLVQRGWSYLARTYRETWADQLAGAEAAGDPSGCGCELAVFLNYVASAYPDPSWMGDALTAAERELLLDRTFARWPALSRHLKSLLALTLHRMGRPRDARLVFDSVMDAAVTTPDEGTFWQPEERSWLWYNDTVESHALALRVLNELRPDDPRRHGLVQWLFLNKKLNQWKSTRATAEVIDALVHYLEREGQLGRRQAAVVTVGGGPAAAFAFEPDRPAGHGNQVVVAGADLDPARSAVTVEQSTPGLLFATATWHFSTAELPAAARGDLFAVERRLFRRSRAGEETVLQPLEDGVVLAPGDEVEVQLSLRSRAPAEYVHLRDPRPAGFEPAAAEGEGAARSGYRWVLGLPVYQEVRDSGTHFFFERLPAGELTLGYRLRASFAGTFRAGPATLQSMYAPELAAHSGGEVVRIEP